MFSCLSETQFLVNIKKPYIRQTIFVAVVNLVSLLYNYAHSFHDHVVIFWIIA